MEKIEVGGQSGLCTGTGSRLLTMIVVRTIID